MNMELSRKRAQEVVRYLTEVKNINPARLEIRGYGESRPSDPGLTDHARKMNRRVEFELAR